MQPISKLTRIHDIGSSRLHPDFFKVFKYGGMVKRLKVFDI